MPIPEHFLQIDEEGYALQGDLRVTDKEVGLRLLATLKLVGDGTLVAKYGVHDVIIEAFDEPYIGQMISNKGGKWFLTLPYGFEIEFNPQSLTVDEWDRFHGYAENGIPFVLSRKAQAELFNLADEYDDDGLTLDGDRLEVPPYWQEEKDLQQSQYWCKIYQGEDEPGWNLKQPAPAFVDMLPRLRLSRSRVLVLGCGDGHDAAFFAQNGHVVTAVDFSASALERAKKNYGHFENIRWIQSDVFKLPSEFDNSFDIIVEHTCYCAVSPTLRNKLVQTWRRCLVDGGHLMGVFFVMEKRRGPPFGGSEWELRQRLKLFQPIFWGRWQKSIEKRQGKELFLYMLKK